MLWAKSATSTMLVVSIGTQSASSAIPALLGAQYTSMTRGLWRIFQASACSRPPLPTIRILIDTLASRGEKDRKVCHAKDFLSTFAILWRLGAHPGPHAAGRSRPPEGFFPFSEPALGSHGLDARGRPLFPSPREPSRDPPRLLGLHPAARRRDPPDRPRLHDDRPGVRLARDRERVARARRRLLVEPRLPVRPRRGDPARPPGPQRACPGEPIRYGDRGRPRGAEGLLRPRPREPRLHAGRAVPVRAARRDAAPPGPHLPRADPAGQPGPRRRLRPQPVHGDPADVAVHDHGGGRGLPAA